MGITTFSGPIKAGTIKDTTGTTLGTDVKNTGQVVMSYFDVFKKRNGVCFQAWIRSREDTIKIIITKINAEIFKGTFCR